MSKKYNYSGARVDAQLQRMKNLQSREVCAFCPQNITQETTSPIIFETDNWIVKENDYPYERTSVHLLLIPKEHKTTISELSPKAQAEFMKVISEIEQKYSLISYALAMRSGDMRRNGGTVEHIHAHIIVGDTDDPNHEPVRFKVSSRPKT